MAASCTSCQSASCFEEAHLQIAVSSWKLWCSVAAEDAFLVQQTGLYRRGILQSQPQAQVSSSSSRCIFDQRGRPRQKVESDIFVCVCLPFLLLHVALLLHNGRSRKDSKAGQQLHAQQRRHQRAEHVQEQRQVTKTHPIILCLSAQHNIQKCVRILADVNALSIDHIM